jgi:hypothetical protein
MALNQNQLQESIVQGALDMQVGNQSISVMVHSSESGELVPGQAVKMVDEAGGVPKVIAAAADTDDILGFINYTTKDKKFVAGDSMEISLVCGGNTMYMTSNAAFARGANLMVVISGSKVATATSNKRIVGIALDKATSSNQLCRVLMLPKGALA